MPNEAPKDTTEQLVQRAIELSTAVKDFQQSLGIVDVVENLEGRTDTVEKLGRKTRFWQKITIAGLLLDLTLTIFGIALFHRVDDNTKANKANTERVNHVVTVLNQQVLCPIYTLVLSAGYHPENHQQDLEAYKATFKVIQEGAKKLECKTPIPSVTQSP